MKYCFSFKIFIAFKWNSTAHYLISYPTILSQNLKKRLFEIQRLFHSSRVQRIPTISPQLSLERFKFLYLSVNLRQFKNVSYSRDNPHQSKTNLTYLTFFRYKGSSWSALRVSYILTMYKVYFYCFNSRAM